MVAAALVAGAGTTFALTGGKGSPTRAALVVASSTTTTSTAAPTTTTTVERDDPAGPNGWRLAHAGTQYVQYLAWTTPEPGKVVGNAYTAQIQGTAPRETVASQTNPITGTIQGSTIALTFGGAGLYNLSQGLIMGTLVKDTLTLTVKTDDGSLGELSFVPSTPADYNQVVEGLGSQVRDDNAAANSALAVQQQRKQGERQAVLKVWNALPVCQADAASQDAQGGYLDFVDCHWPDGHSAVCNPYYPDHVDGLPQGTACPDYRRTPSQKWDGIGTAPNGYPTGVSAR